MTFTAETYNVLRSMRGFRDEKSANLLNVVNIKPSAIIGFRLTAHLAMTISLLSSFFAHSTPCPIVWDFATFPTWAVNTPHNFITTGSATIIMPITLTATYMASAFDFLITLKAISSVGLSAFFFSWIGQCFVETFEASVSGRVNQLTTINAMVVSFYPPIMRLFTLAHSSNYTSFNRDKQPSRSRG